MKRDGSSPRPVTSESFRLVNGGAFAPDGRSVVARRHFTGRRSLGAGEIWLYSLDGGSGLQLVPRRTSEKDINEPAYSPDGRYLYYSEDVTPGERFEYNRDPNGEIYQIKRLDLSTGEVRAFVTGPGGSIRPTPSPDGASLAFVRRDRFRSVLHVLDLASGRERQLTDRLDRDQQEGWAIHGTYPAMAWSPDSRRIFFWAEGRIWSIAASGGEPQQIPFHVRGRRTVSDAVRARNLVAPNQFNARMLQWASFSPDGRNVVFQALGWIWVKALGTGAVTRLTRQEREFEFYPSFSPDGTQIIHSTWSDQDLGRIVSTSLSGRARPFALPSGPYGETALSPDGSWLAFRRLVPGQLLSGVNAREPGLYLVPARGGVPVLVNRSGGEPGFSADSRRLFYTDHVSEENQSARVLDLETRRESVIATGRYLQMFAVSPDQRWIAWKERHEIYLAPLPATGGAIRLEATSSALPIVRLSAAGGTWPTWSPDSNMLSWSWGDTLYRCSVDEGPHQCTRNGSRAEPEAIRLTLSGTQDRPGHRIALIGARIVTMRGDEVIEDGAIIVEFEPDRLGGETRGAPTNDFRHKLRPSRQDDHSRADRFSLAWPRRGRRHHAATGLAAAGEPGLRSHDPFRSFKRDGGGFRGQRACPHRSCSFAADLLTGATLNGAETPWTARIENYSDALNHVLRQRSAGAVAVKSYNLPRRDQRQQVVAAARSLGMSVVPESGSVFNHAMTNIIDGHTTIEHSLACPSL